MQPANRPWWQQATALVSVSVSGAVTGLSFVPQATADVASPASLPIRLLALERSAQPEGGQARDGVLRSAIVNVARYYLRLADGRTPAEMEAIIWQHASLDGADHGASCAAFASLTLELAAQAVGQRSWVTGGTSYPWPLHKWADARVEPNPASPGITSVLQDARTHHRWHPLDSGYRPQPGDWVLFHGHVEVVTGYHGGVLHTVGGDSLPDFSVNAHEYPDPLGKQGVLGFVNNGALARARKAGRSHPASRWPQAQRPHARTGGTAPASTASRAPASPAPASAGSTAATPAGSTAPAGGTAIPGVTAATGRGPVRGPHAGAAPGTEEARPAGSGEAAAAGTAAIPGLPALVAGHSGQPEAGGPVASYHRHHPPAAPVPRTPAQQAFISEVAPGAIAAQHEYGVPASVTIAQAIDESGWGKSVLARRDHNLFGIKGTGPAGRDLLPTQEYVGGQYVTQTGVFRVYHDAAESISDHGRMLATSGYYRQAMARRHDPDAFATSLTGVYATDPAYGTKLIELMRRYDLYRYDAQTQGQAAAAGAPKAAAGPGRRAAPRAARAASRPAGRRTGAPTGQRRGADVPASSGTGATFPASKGPGAAMPSSGRAGATVPPSKRLGATRHARQAPGRLAQPAIPGTGVIPAPPSGEVTAPGAAAGPGRPAVPGTTAALAAGQDAAGQAAARQDAARQDAAGQAAARQDAAGQAAAGQAAGDASAEPPVTARTTAFQIPSAAGAGYAARVPAQAIPPAAGSRDAGRAGRSAGHGTRRYRPELPPSVRTAFTAMARVPLLQEEPLYRDVASELGIRWEFLAACDWMQCRAHPRHSPVHGEKLGTINPDGTVYRTKSEALGQCADDLVALARAVYHIDVTAARSFSVRELANVFAAFRWGGLLRAHRTSAMEFPYSVAGLTAQHMAMRWPNIDEPRAPDKPGSRFRMPFGAVPVMLCLGYPATV